MPDLPETPSPAALRRSIRAAAALAAFGCLIGISLPSFAQWKWRDADGRTQYSDRPPPMHIPAASILQRPPGAPAETVVQIKALPKPGEAASTAAPPASSASPAAMAASRAAEAQLEARKRQAQAAEEAQRREQDTKLAQQKAENCTKAKENLRTLESGMRIVRVTPQGEREYLSDNQRAQEVGNAQRTAANDCR